MSLNNIKRRKFLKIMGWSGAGATLAGCDMPTTMTVQEGKEEVVSYLSPEEYVIPGVGVWYASTCQQCAAGCGVHGRVREGRVLKLEGNPSAAVNAGKLCQMGQSALQTHYNPDRITAPQIRSNGALSSASWDEAYDLLKKKIGADSGLKGNRAAWVTGNVSGHQSVLIDAHMEALGSSKHYTHEVINDSVWQAVSKDMLGVANPRVRIDKAQAILSLGADFLGTWGSPVQNAVEYGSFRDSPRGALIQAEPTMSLTGSNADLWLPVKPGTEGVLALGIANVLMSNHGVKNIPSQFKSLVKQYTLEETSRITGLTGEHILFTAKTLKERSPSLVLAGASAQGHENGYEIVAAAMMLNIVLGNLGKTVEGGTQLPFSQMMASEGNTRDLLALADDLGASKYDVLFFYGTNPVYSAPEALKIKDGLKNVGFKVAFSMFNDETTAEADLVLPLASSLEDWGTHVAAKQGARSEVSIQQPLMEKIYPETMGFGDIMLSLLKMQKVDAYAGFNDYYSYLRNAVNNMPGFMAKNGGEAWKEAMQAGSLEVKGRSLNVSSKAISIKMSVPADDAQYPLTLIPSARLGLWDGRHANLPWLQEAPDQMTKVVWDSWVEIHPRTAAKMGVKEGDLINVASEQGTIKAKAYIYKGVNQDSIAIPIGQGHKGYGRYADGVGVNPLQILNPAVDKKTGELAMFATRVKISKAGSAKDKLVRMGGSETQVGRKLAATISADVFERTEGDA